MHGQIDGWMDGQMDGWMDGQMDGQMGRWMYGQTDGWIDEWIEEWMDKQIHSQTKSIYTQNIIKYLILKFIIHSSLFDLQNNNFVVFDKFFSTCVHYGE